MIKYDETRKEITLCKLEKTVKCSSYTENLQDDYKEYMANTVYEDVLFFFTTYNKYKFRADTYIPSMEELKKNVSINLVTQNAKNNISGTQAKVYRVSSYYLPANHEACPSVANPVRYDLFDIPYLEKDGLLNFDGTFRAFIHRLEPSPGLSLDKYTDAGASVFLQFPNTLGKVHVSKNKATIEIGKKSLDILQLAYNMTIDKKSTADTRVINPLLLNCSFIRNDKGSLGSARVRNDRLISNLAKGDSFTRVDDIMRSRLNKTLGFASALGEVEVNINVTDNTLTTFAEACTLGKRITQEIVDELNASDKRWIYIRSVPNVIGCYYEPIPGGAKAVVTEGVLREMDKRGAWSISVWDPSKLDALPVEYPFVREVLTNKIPADLVATTNPNTLNAFDLASIYSLVTRIYDTNATQLLHNRDAALIKSVQGFKEAFSTSLREVMTEWITPSRSTNVIIVKGSRCNRPEITPHGELSNYTMKYMTINLQKKLNKAQRLQTVDGVNLVSVMSQVTKSNVIMSGKHIPKGARDLSLLQFGKICPFESPQGGKLGLVRNLARGCVLTQEGDMKTPYRRVIAKGDTITLSPAPTYLSPEEERSYIIGNLTDLVPGSTEGTYTSSLVSAKIPAPPGSTEPVILFMVESKSLNFVQIDLEQHISYASSLIPFACMDDAVRLTFAIGMLKQAVPVIDPDKPYVYTDTYKDMISDASVTCISAPTDGEVLAIGKGDITIKPYDKDENVVVPIPAGHHTSANLQVFRLSDNVKVGDRIGKGEILAEATSSVDGVYSPAKNVLVIYAADGFEYEDAVKVNKSTANKFKSYRRSKFSLNYNTSRDAQIDENGCLVSERGRMFRLSSNLRHVEKGDTLLRYEKAGNSKVNIVKEFKSAASGYIYYTDHEPRDSFKPDRRVMNVYTLDVNELSIGDKVAGRHGNKGVTSRVEPDFRMYKLPNGEMVEMVLNPCGIPSRMNPGQILEAHYGFIAHLLGVSVISNSFNGGTCAEASLFLHWLHELANCGCTDSNEFAGVVDSISSRYSEIPTSLVYQAKARFEEITHWAGAFNTDGTTYVYDPVNNEYLENKITFGYAYCQKLVHEADKKMHTRGGPMTEEYEAKSNQPHQGASNGGGQATGEMEFCALASFYASSYIRELTNERSDNLVQREKYREMLEKGQIYATDESNYTNTPSNAQGLNHLVAYLRVCGIDMDVAAVKGRSFEGGPRFSSCERV